MAKTPKTTSRKRGASESSAMEVDGKNESPKRKTSHSSPEKKPGVAMDVVVHRMRHLDYKPHPIVCLRATPTSVENDSSFVALSRENGSVELKAPNEKFRTIAEIAGYKHKVVNAMAWLCATTDTTATSRPTLVGGSRDGTLFVVDFSSGILTGMTASGGGGVYCLSSLCQNQVVDDEESAKLVAAGCEDGSIRIFKVDATTNRQQPSIDLMAIIPSASSAAILSVAWRKTPKGGMILFAGVADGTIRRYDWDPSADTTGKKGSWKSALRMTVENLGRNTPTRVWVLQLLSDGTVISGDSLGHVQFWDGDTGTLIQSFDQNDSKADVFEIAVASEECKVFASGVDSRVVCIERSRTTVQEGVTDSKWILTQARRPHTHDVKAMTVCRQRVRQLDKARNVATDKHKGDSTVELLCTGGIDTKLCTYYVDGFKRLRPRSLYPWPAFSPVAQANGARVLILRREGQIDLYRVDDSPLQQPLKEAFGVPEEDTRIGLIELDSPCNLSCATISDDGRFLAACDATSFFVFRLEYVKNSQGTTAVPTRLSAKTKGSPFVCLKFGSNDTLLAASSSGDIHVMQMPDDAESECRVTMILRPKQGKRRHNDGLFPVQSIVFSKHKMWFAVLQGGLDKCYVRLFSYDNDSQKYHPWWALPDLEAPVTAVRFLEIENKAPELVASCSNFAFYSFNVVNRQLSKWSEDTGMPVSKHLPAEMMNRNDYPIRITSNPTTPSKILLGSFGAFALIDLAKPAPKECRIVPEHHVRRKKKRKQEEPRKRGRLRKESDSVVCLRYNSILHMDFIAENEMVIVEQPWLNVIATFPAPLERKIYAS